MMADEVKKEFFLSRNVSLLKRHVSVYSTHTFNPESVEVFGKLCVL